MNAILRWLRRRELAAIQARLYQRTPRIVTEEAQKRANLERLMALADVGTDHPVWNVVLSYLDEHEQNEMEAALRSDLDDAGRHYNAGRAASARDLATALRQLQLQAETEARKLKG